MPAITGSNVTIMTRNMDESIRFYEHIGLALKQRWDNHYAMMTAEGITIGIHPYDGSSETGSGTLSIGFMIAEVDDVKTLLEQNGIDYKEEADGKSGIYLHFKDPDGTQLYFVKPMW